MNKRALLSVSDKTGIEDLARKLVACGYEILSTGGTKKALEKAKIPVTAAEDVTKFPECFSGRVKTMHPLLLGGILYKRNDKEHVAEAKKLGIEPIDLVVINLYPFEDAVKSGKHGDDLIEQIDIGGPTLLRSAAKNHESVTVVCDPADYGRVLAEIEKSGDTSPELRSELASKVFARTCSYDGLIAKELSGGQSCGGSLVDGQKLRYGENPHQWGMYYDYFETPADKRWKILQAGKEVSYLNILDADGAWNAVCGFDEPTAVFVKHANPCGVSSHEDLAEAFQRAFDADRLSAFGVIIALNRPCTAAIAQKMIDQKIFAEVIIAPGYDKDALQALAQKPKLRIIEYREKPKADSATYRSALGGVLLQNPDVFVPTENDLTCVTDKKPTKEQTRDLLFAWKTVKATKSNAIVFASDRTTVGIGAGQTSRVDAVWIAAKRAGKKSQGAVMASDAFFPFPDSLEEAAKAGIAAVIQPGGSVKDEEVIAKANELGLAMVVTGKRAFLH